MSKSVVANTGIYEHEEVIKSSSCGILVPFEAKAFADAIIHLLNSPEEAKAMGLAGKEWVINNRSYDTLTKQLEKLYIMLLEKQS